MRNTFLLNERYFFICFGLSIIIALSGCTSAPTSTRMKNIAKSSLSNEKALTLDAWGENEVIYSQGFASTTLRTSNYFGTNLELRFSTDENERHSGFPYIFVSVRNVGSQAIEIDNGSFSIVREFSKDMTSMVQPSIRELANYYELMADKKNRLEGAYAAFTVAAAAATATSRTNSEATVVGNYRGNTLSAFGTANSTTTNYGATAQVAVNSIENARQRAANNEAQANFAGALIRKIAFKKSTLRPNEVAEGALFFGVKDQAHTRYKISLTGDSETSVSFSLSNY